MDVSKAYPVNEVFCSLQGEGARAGLLHVFVRFAGCNLTCRRDGEAGFDCDTEFVSSAPRTADEIAALVTKRWPTTRMAPRVILTGGEPLLHVNEDVLEALHRAGVPEECISFETNGTRELPRNAGRAYVACSPKTAEHTLRLERAGELRYVRHALQGIPVPRIPAEHLFLSPAWSDDAAARRANLDHCIALVHANPQWRLSVQQHKLWLLR